MSTLTSLRQFVATIVAASPRNALLSALVMLSLSLTEGMTLLLLVPLLQLVGVEAPGGTGGGVGEALATAFSWVGVRPTLGSVLGLFVAVAICQSFLQRWHLMLSAALRQQAEAILRMRLYRAIAGAQWRFFTQSRLSDFSHMLTQELDRIGMAAHDLVDVAVSALIVAVYVGVALRVSPGTTLFVLVCGGVLAWILRGRVAAAHGHGVAMTASRAELHSAVSEHLGSMKTARCYGALDRHDRIFSGLTDEVQDGNLRTIASYARLRQETVVGSALVLAIIVYVSRAVLTIPTAHLLLLLFVFTRLMPRLTGLLERAQNFATLLPSFARFHDLESRCESAAELPVDRHRPLTFDRDIRVAQVSFSYGPGAALAVQDVDLTIRAGTTVAIVGPSGGGKSTLADLLLGLIVPTRGVILVDGEPLERVRYDAWRDQIGYVTQDTFLFHDTVRANLLWARPNATENDLRDVLRMAAADDFVSRLPAGLETVVGDRGVLVSGGERQRLSLARALLRRPRLLVLDEATNALDSENEARIQEAIDALRHRMTIVVITHRLSMVRGADVIHVLDRGRVLESGTWAELSARPGSRFAQLCRAQGVEMVAPAGLKVVGR